MWAPTSKPHIEVVGILQKKMASVLESRLKQGETVTACRVEGLHEAVNGSARGYATRFSAAPKEA